MLSFPPFRLDPDDERLWRDGREIRLRRKPFAILRYLAENSLLGAALWEGPRRIGWVSSNAPVLLAANPSISKNRGIESGAASAPDASSTSACRNRRSSPRSTRDQAVDLETYYAGGRFVQYGVVNGGRLRTR